MNKRGKNENRTADLIADYFIFKGIESNKPVSNKKLQKLLYYAQAWGLVLNKKPLFKEKIEAWVHGPAIRSIYLKYKDFSFNPIIKDVNKKRIRSIDDKTKYLLDEVWRVYGSKDAEYLELLTHNEDPWQKAREGLSDCQSSSNEITLESMKKYYSKLLKDEHSKN